MLPDTGQDHVSYYDPSAYVGCAQHAASALFAEAREDVRANEFPFYTGTQPAVTTTRLRRHLIGYRAMVDGVPVDGIAFYDARADLPFFKLEVSLPTELGDLATPMLKRRLPPRQPDR